MGAVGRVWWTPVGAGGHVSRHTSAWWERAVAAREHRPPQRLVHAVLEVESGGAADLVDMGPTWGRKAVGRRDVVTVGPVGSRALGWCPLFRYEIRVVHGAHGPAAAVHVSDPFVVPDRLLDRLADVPATTWGRDEARAGEMWTSNSVVSWLLECCGVTSVAPPPGHRAPGWAAGTRLARP